ncbi:hypothetical protein [Halorussus marinus]|uniref:hypothetical protein n=1 Tax=Halorussus marinus TaxID=2505976 RepID=UPI00106E693D|nr:hypothetical protein [Halorussus marinus]
MPRVEKTRGGKVYIQSVDRFFELGDQADVDTDEASYLVDERGDFDLVDSDATDASADASGDDEREEIAPHELTLDELEDALDRVDDVHVLDSIEMREDQGKDREGAYGLIDSRRSELED